MAEVCDDGDDCTTDSCEVDQCVYVAPGGDQVSTLCDDGDLYWVDGCGRVSDKKEDCDDGKDCTADDCDSAAEACTHTPLTDGCCEPNASVACIGGDLYSVDSCGNTGNLAEDCTDGDPCTTDGCAAGACVHTAAPLPECPPCPPHDTTACLADAVIWVDGCGAPGAVLATCDDKDDCTIDTCDAKSAKCVHIPQGGCTPACSALEAPACAQRHLMWVDSCGQAQGLAESCEDGNPCSVDTCPAGGESCFHTAAINPECGCGEAAQTACSGGDVVWLDGCGVQVSVAVDCDDGDPCTDDGCDPDLTECINTPNEDCPAPEEDLGPVPDEDGASEPDAGSPGNADPAPREDTSSGPRSDASSSGSADLGLSDGPDVGPPTVTVVDNGGCATPLRATHGAPLATLLLVLLALAGIRGRGPRP